jgi:adenylate kinase family enzyme
MHADIIIFLDMPRYLCIWRILWRLAKNRGKVSASSAQDCPERFDLNFLKFVWHFNKRFRKYINLTIKDFESEKQVFVLKSVQEVNAFIELLQREITSVRSS